MLSFGQDRISPVIFDVFSVGLTAIENTTMTEGRRDTRRSSSLQQKEVAVTSVLGKAPHIASIDENATFDDKTLGALGYKQEFKR